MKNAAIFAAQIIARSNKNVAALFKKFKLNQCRIIE
jgi:phosphoribosylcarboxyaminoimidazole (NCAIR) mutase